MVALLGIDIGTTATKVSVAALDGRVLAEGSRPCTITSLRPGWAEADPHEWWANLVALVPDVLARAGVARGDVAAVGVSGMVPTLICLDAVGMPLRASIQQNDGRATDEIRAAEARLVDHDVLARTGSAITAQSIGPKVRWLATHEPDVLARTRTLCGSYEWVIGRMTGERVAERNWALESGMWDLREQRWDPRLLDEYGIDAAWLAAPRASHEIVGGMRSDVAEELGLTAGTPVSAGAADHIASTFSAGLTGEGDLLVKLGGAGDIMLSMREPRVDARLFLDHHILPEHWILNGCMAASGAVLRWFQRELAGGAPFAQLDDEAAALPPGSDGLVMLPYFLGEKSPLQDPDARGVLAGLHLGHTRAHLYRASLEAIAFGFAHHLEVFSELGLVVRRSRVTNGGSRSRLWRTIVADVLGIELASLVSHPGSGLGSAFSAGVGVGVLAWDDIESWTVVDEVIEPDPSRAAVYAERYAQYRSLYTDSLPTVHALAASQASAHEGAGDE